MELVVWEDARELTVGGGDEASAGSGSQPGLDLILALSVPPIHAVK